MGRGRGADRALGRAKRHRAKKNMIRPKRRTNPHAWEVHAARTEGLAAPSTQRHRIARPPRMAPLAHICPGMSSRRLVDPDESTPDYAPQSPLLRRWRYGRTRHRGPNACVMPNFNATIHWRPRRAPRYGPIATTNLGGHGANITAMRLLTH